MKSLFVAAGLFGAVGLLTAAPASAEESWVACAPAILCHIAGVPGQAAENIATAPGRAYQNIVTAPGRAYQNITTAPGHAYQNIATAPQRAFTNIATAPGRAFNGHHDGAETRARQHPRAVRTCSRSGVTAVDWRSVVIVVTRSLVATLIRYALVGTALVHPSTRWAWERPTIWRAPFSLWWCSASNQLGDVRFLARQAFADRHVWYRWRQTPTESRRPGSRSLRSVCALLSDATADRLDFWFI